LSPLPVDNRALPHDDPFLIHGQPNSGLNALHQFNNNSNGTPYYGHNPRLPFSYSDSSLRAQSAAPRVGGTPHGGYQPLFSVPNQREQPAHQYQQGYSDGPDQPSGLNATIARLLADVQRLSESMDQQHIINNQLLTSNQQLENSNQQLVESNQQLTMCVKAIELLQTESKNMGKKKAGSKNVSNEHSLLKVSYRTIE
jgi:hypothetical protein